MRSTSRHLSQSRKRKVTTLARGCLQSPVAACVSSLVNLGFSARLDGQQQPYFIPWYTVAHGGDPDACFMSRWSFYLPNSSSVRRLPPCRGLHGPSNFAAVWYHPRRNHFSQGAHHADPGQHNGSVQGAQHAVPVLRRLQRE